MKINKIYSYSSNNALMRKKSDCSDMSFGGVKGAQKGAILGAAVSAPFMIASFVAGVVALPILIGLGTIYGHIEEEKENDRLKFEEGRLL